MTTLKIALAEAPAPQEIKQLEVSGRKPVALYNLNGDYFATDDTCTHGEASLAEGDIEGEEVICPFHMGAFDIRSGEATMAPCSEALRTYPVVLDGDEIVIELGP